jgi:hypothetical protein
VTCARNAHKSNISRGLHEAGQQACGHGGRGADRGPDAEGMILPPDERLEVIVDDRLTQLANVFQASGMKEDCVPAELLRHPGDGGLGGVGRKHSPKKRGGA